MTHDYIVRGLAYGGELEHMLQSQQSQYKKHKHVIIHGLLLLLLWEEL